MTPTKILQRPPRILVVDDEGDLRFLIRLALDPLGAEIRELDHGVNALTEIRSFKPDLVILDIMLPGGIDGLQLCRAIKLDPQTAATTVFLLTAKGQVADIEAGARAGADQYIVKPFSPLALYEAVATCWQH